MSVIRLWTIGLVGGLALPALAQQEGAPGDKPAPRAPADDEVGARIRDLGSPDFETREKAEARLVELGERAARALGEAAKDEDPEVARRAERALRKIRRTRDRAEDAEPGRARDPGGDPWQDLFGGDPRDLDAIRKRFEESRRRLEEALGGDWDPLRDVEKHLRRAFGEDWEKQQEGMRRRLEDLGRGRGDLGEKLREQLRRLLGEGWDEAWPDIPRPPQGPGFRLEFGGPGTKSQMTVIENERKVSVTRDGEKVKVEVTEPGENGKPQTKVYEAENEGEFREKYPEVAKYVGPAAGGGQWRFDLGRWRRGGAAGRPDRTAARAPRVSPASEIGLVAEPASRELRFHLGLEEGRGLFVREVAEGSWGARAGLQRFDLVLSAAGKPVGKLADLEEAVKAAEAEIPLEIHRRGQALKLAAGK
ncbi:MAG: hypothetical protein L0216_06165 [Planctomycetales bacterium]|nr:hypothetical protein [Planctomycetales bacterium]